MLCYDTLLGKCCMLDKHTAVLLCWASAGKFASLWNYSVKSSQVGVCAIWCICVLLYLSTCKLTCVHCSVCLSYAIAMVHILLLWCFYNLSKYQKHVLLILTPVSDELKFKPDSFCFKMDNLVLFTHVGAVSPAGLQLCCVLVAGLQFFVREHLCLAFPPGRQMQWRGSVHKTQ